MPRRTTGASSPPPAAVEGLAFGEYEIVVRQASGTSREPHAVEISPADRFKTVTLQMQYADRRLRIVDGEGRPLRAEDVQIRASNNQKVSAIEPGVWSLTNVPAGTELRIHVIGYARTCRVVPPDGDVAVVLLPVGSLNDCG